MVLKYVTTLLVTVALVTYVAASTDFVTKPQVLCGNAVDETFPFEFTVYSNSSHSYVMDPAMAQFLQEHIVLHADGPLRILAAKVLVEPKKVSWTNKNTKNTAPGAALTVEVQWDAPTTSANGSRGSIYLDLPVIPGLEGEATIYFDSGDLRRDNFSASRYIIRQATAYQNASTLRLARFLFALALGLPFGILLHSIVWAFVLIGVKRSRISAFPPHGTGLPRTFYPHPIWEWKLWLIALGTGAAAGSFRAFLSISDGFLISTFTASSRAENFAFVACAFVIGLVIVHYTRKTLVTVRVETGGIAYARGRSDLQWENAAWNEILKLEQKSRTYRGNTVYWIDIIFRDARDNLRIEKNKMVDYPALRDLLVSLISSSQGRPGSSVFSPAPDANAEVKQPS